MDFLSCCRSSRELEAAIAGGSSEIRHIQSNLIREKTGFRCADCGAFYPFLEIHHCGEVIAPKSISKPLGKRLKYPKASEVFRGSHYYARNKKTLMRFDIDADGNGCQTEEYPIMGDVWYVAVSPDGRYIATETNGGTAVVLDAHSGENVAKRRSFRSEGSFLFAGSGSLVYFRRDDGIFCWDFLQDRETVLWQVPQSWRAGDGLPVFCRTALQAGADRMVFQVSIGIESYAVILDGTDTVKTVRLPDSRGLSRLTHTPDPDRYLLPVGDVVQVFDGDFRLTEVFSYPKLCNRSDGGGVFPIDTFFGAPPHRAFLSRDGKWVLLDFFNEIVLMERDTGNLRYCVYSDNGGATRFMGFLDDKHIWYNWGNSTYIMELGPRQEKK